MISISILKLLFFSDYSWRWFWFESTRFWCLRFRRWIRSRHELAYEHWSTFVFANAGLCHRFEKAQLPHYECKYELFKTVRILTKLLVWVSIIMDSTIVCFSLQGDLDRQRLLGNRQHSGVYESVVDDCVEGIEHQERWVGVPTINLINS